MVTTKRPAARKWLFPSLIRPNAFTGKSSSTAVTRIKEAVAEVKTVSRNDPVAAANGAVRLIERLSPALEHVDSSSGAIATAVNRAIETLVPIITAANVSTSVREKWLERRSAYHAALKAAEALGRAEETKAIIRNWVAAERPEGFVRQVLGRELDLL